MRRSHSVFSTLILLKRVLCIVKVFLIYPIAFIIANNRQDEKRNPD